jgi:hypothetical protein
MLPTLAWGIALTLFMIVGNAVRLSLLLQGLRDADKADVGLASRGRASSDPPQPPSKPSLMAHP